MTSTIYFSNSRSLERPGLIRGSLEYVLKLANIPHLQKKSWRILIKILSLYFKGQEISNAILLETPHIKKLWKQKPGKSRLLKVVCNTKGEENITEL